MKDRFIYARDGIRWYVIDLAERSTGHSFNGEWVDGAIVEECRTREEARAACRERNEAQT